MSRTRQVSTTYRFTALVVVLSLVAGLAALASGSRAASAAPLYAVPSLSVSVPAGGSATITVRGVALTPGATIPAGPLVLAQQPLAVDRLRTAVFYGIDWGYADSAPAQVALALWQLQDGVWHSEDRAVAERIAAAAATSQGTPSWLPDGNSVLQAVSMGQARLSELTLVPLIDNASVGTGSLTVSNTGFGDALLHLPYGTVFSGPSGSVIVWAAPALPGAQSTPSTLPSDPTATATVEPAIATPMPTFEPAPGPIKGDPATATPVTEATETARPKDPTSTPVPPTDTPSPEPPTATVAPTYTPEPAPTNTPAAQVEEQVTGKLSPEREVDAPPAAPDPKTANGKTQEVDAAPSAPLPPSSDATATAESEGGVPAPVGTSVQASAPLPQPVGTQPGVVIPNPVGTVAGTPGGGAQVPSPVASRPPTSQAGITPSPVPTKEQVAEPTSTVAATAEATAEATVEVPTPAPTPVPVPPTPVESTGEGPIINVAPENNSSETAGGGVEPSTGETGTSGTPQTYNPNTGGGGSMVPLWLGLLSAVMVLGGWSLRRVSMPSPVRLRSDDEPE